MKTQGRLLRGGLLVFLLGAFAPGALVPCPADDEIVIGSYLMKGFGEPGPLPRSDASDGNSGRSLLLHVSGEDGGSGEKAFAFLRAELGSMFQFPSVMGLTSATMTWDGKKEYLNEAVVLDDVYLYPIQFHFHSLQADRLLLSVEGFKFRFSEVGYPLEYAHLKREISYGEFELLADTRRVEDGIGGEKWLDAEVTLPMGAPMILVFPCRDRSYFLAVSWRKREARQFSIGLVSPKLESFTVSDADPICGRIVGRGDGIGDKNRAAASRTYKGYMFLFCSQACLERFEKDPESCLKKSKVRYFNQTTFTRNPWNPSFIEVQNTPRGSPESASSRPFLLVRPEFPEGSLKSGVHGVVKTEVRTDRRGRVTDVQVLEPVPAELAAAAVAALGQWRYDPLPKDGESASSPRCVDVDFMPGQESQDAGVGKIVESPTRTEATLRAAGDYCRRLEEAALNYVCMERVKETVFFEKHLFHFVIKRYPPKARNSKMPDPILAFSRGEGRNETDSTYDYQLVRREGRITEQRILMAGNEARVGDAISLPEVRRVYFSKPIFGPIGLLSRESQPLYDYSPSREELVAGRPTWVVEITPKKPMSGGPNRGRAWVDKQNGSVLKMAYEAESLEGYERIQQDYVTRGGRPVFSIEILFGFEKKGLHYPSRMLIQERYADPAMGRIKVSETTVEYDHYRFFTVETDDRIK